MSNKEHGILDTLKHLAFEDEPEPSPVAHNTPAAVSAPSVSTVSTPFASNFSLPIDAGVVPDDDQVYRKLVSKTEFESTDIAVTIHKFLQPLSAIADSVMPPNVKFKTAVLQAKAQAGLTEDAILAAFDQMKAVLQQEQDAFAGKAQQFQTREIANRQDRIAQVTEQITQLQQELAQLSTELVDAQGKAAHAQAQFNAAVQRRSGEIEQQKAQYAALLKG